MIKFEWEYYKTTRDNTYISWQATWDGRWDNDELIEPGDYWGENYEHLDHPFSGTVDYKQSKYMYEHYLNMSDEERKRDLIIQVQQSDGSYKDENLGNSEDVDPEEHNPEKLRKCGDIVAVNPVTRAICELLSDVQKLRASSGNVHPISYRSTLLACLSMFWD